MIRTKVHGRGQLAKRFRELPELVREEVTKAAVKGAHELADAQRALVPVDKGDLRDSIAVTGPGETTPPYSHPGGSEKVPDHAAVVTVGNTDVRYGHLVEYGTMNAPSQAFFWPAYRLLKKRIQGRMTRAARKAIRRERGT